MQPLFETSGWALPKKIVSQNQSDSGNKKKKSAAVDVNDSRDEKASKEADQLQAQLHSLSNNEQPESNKSKKNKNKNKKRLLEEDKSEKISENENKKKKAKVDNKNTKEKKQEQQGQQQQEQPNKGKNSQKKEKLQALLAKKNKPIESRTEKSSTEKGKQTKPVQAIQKPNESLDDGLTPLQRKMKEKLSGARFRWLNEQLYTTPGKHSFTLFQEKPELFDEYHEGFRHQVESWPVNPVDIIINQCKKLPKDTVIVDLGCGDAMVAQTLTKQKVLSYDLIAKNDLVTACDISKLPLKANSVDVAVFSLSLMGTNYLDFLKEAHRVLKVGGELKIAEVVSRFSNLDSFITLLEDLGFDFMDKEDDNKMFVMLYFTKQLSQEQELDEEMLGGLSKTQKRSLKKGAGINNSNVKLQKKAQQLLKPCLYKKR